MKVLQTEQRYTGTGSIHRSQRAALTAYFKLSYLTKVLLNDSHFSYLWDNSKINKLQPTFGFRRGRNGLFRYRKACGVSGRFGGRNRLTGLSRFHTKLMMERGILPGMYGAGW